MERIREYSWCCSTGGGMLEAYPNFAAWTARECIEETKAPEAEALATACPCCVRVFRDTIQDMDEDLRIYDVMDLLETSLGSE